MTIPHRQFLGAAAFMLVGSSGCGLMPSSGLVPQLIVGDRLRLTGHFDDPAAQGCRMATGDPAVLEPDELAIVYCRERFVATSVEVVGD